LCSAHDADDHLGILLPVHAVNGDAFRRHLIFLLTASKRVASVSIMRLEETGFISLAAAYATCTNVCSKTAASKYSAIAKMGGSSESVAMPVAWFGNRIAVKDIVLDSMVTAALSPPTTPRRLI
jgi:hypothetical protein